jgi:hypothetical protein
MAQRFLLILLSIIFIQCSNNSNSSSTTDELRNRYKLDSSLYSIIVGIQGEVKQNFSGTARVGDASGECKIRLIRGVDTALINAQVVTSVNIEQYGANYQSRKYSAEEEYAFYGFSPTRSGAAGFTDKFSSSIFPVVFEAPAKGKGDYGQDSRAYFAIDTVNKELTCIILGHNGGFSYYGSLPLSDALLQKAIASFKELSPPDLLKPDLGLTSGYESNGYGGYTFYFPEELENLQNYRIFTEADTTKLHSDYIVKKVSFYKIMFFNKKEIQNQMGNFYIGDIYNSDSVLVTKDCYISLDDPWVYCGNMPFGET